MSEENPSSLNELFQTAQRMQSELSRIQSDLAKMTVEGTAGGGMVKALANGRQQILSLSFEKEVVDPNEVQMLQDLVVAAVNQALSKSLQLAQQEMGKVTGQMNLKLAGLF
jgi:nucleoid-associated protein EbfC